MGNKNLKQMYYYLLLKLRAIFIFIWGAYVLQLYIHEQVR